jgi:hypothetical protein
VAPGGGRRCQQVGCTKAAAGGGTLRCKAHGGGRRCQEEGCSKSAATGGMLCCTAHGGGKRCQQEDCTTSTCKSALVDTEYCAAHGGGRRCQKEGCPKPAVGGGTQHCVAHGGGKRCQKEGCPKSVAKGPGAVYCRLCLQDAQPDDVLEAALQRPSDAHAPQATAGIEGYRYLYVRQLHGWRVRVRRSPQASNRKRGARTGCSSLVPSSMPRPSMSNFFFFRSGGQMWMHPLSHCIISEDAKSVHQTGPYMFRESTCVGARRV